MNGNYVAKSHLPRKNLGLFDDAEGPHEGVAQLILGHAGHVGSLFLLPLARLVRARLEDEGFGLLNLALGFGHIESLVGSPSHVTGISSNT